MVLLLITLTSFYFEYKNPKIERKEWIATIALRMVEALSDNTKQTYFFNLKSRNVQEFKVDVRKSYESAVSNHSKYLKTGKFTKHVFESALLLAQLDLVYRAFFFFPNVWIL